LGSFRYNMAGGGMLFLGSTAARGHRSVAGGLTVYIGPAGFQVRGLAYEHHIYLLPISSSLPFFFLCVDPFILANETGAIPGQVSPSTPIRRRNSRFLFRCVSCTSA